VIEVLSLVSNIKVAVGRVGLSPALVHSKVIMQEKRAIGFPFPNKIESIALKHRVIWFAMDQVFEYIKVNNGIETETSDSYGGRDGLP
jgi:hypothetical protein